MGFVVALMLVVQTRQEVAKVHRLAHSSIGLLPVVPVVGFRWVVETSQLNNVRLGYALIHPLWFILTPPSIPIPVPPSSPVEPVSITSHPPVFLLLCLVSLAILLSSVTDTKGHDGLHMFPKHTSTNTAKQGFVFLSSNIPTSNSAHRGH